MRLVQSKSWRDYFVGPKIFKRSETPRNLAQQYYIKRRIFSKLLFYLILTILSLIVGAGAREGLVVGLSLIIYAAYLYGLGWASAQGLRITRTISPKRIFSGESVTVTITLENRSAFQLKDLLVVDQFQGAADPTESIWIDEDIGPGRSIQKKYLKKCNVGMGTFAFTPLRVRSYDPLGIFEFYVTEDEKSLVEVYPKMDVLPQVAMQGSFESLFFGIYDIQKRGGELNFSGVRDFSRGDSLRHIAWKQTAKHSRLLVKDFERVVDTPVSIVIELGNRSHIGTPAKSTWEYCKRLALNLVSQQVNNGNPVQVLTQGKIMPFGRGADHYHWTALELMNLLPQDDQNEMSLLQKYDEFFPPGSTVFYISPTAGQAASDAEKVLFSLMRLTERGIRVTGFLIDSASLIPLALDVDSKSNVLKESNRYQATLQKYAKNLNELKIPIFIIPYVETEKMGEYLLENTLLRR